MQTITTDKKVLIIGLGMLGASYAKALKKHGFYIIAVTLDPDDIDYALDRHFIDEGYTQPLPEVIGQGDIVIFALYPHTFVDWIEQYQQLLKSGAFLTDVTGVKSYVVHHVQSILRPDVEFVPAHPMAGKEGQGIVQSSDTIFHRANYIVTPTEKNTPEGIRACEELGKLLGFSRISHLSVEEHDRVIGFVSQLTHCIAVALMTCNDQPHLEEYTGDSFRDLTRIARINDALWSELFVMNKTALLEQMDLFDKEFKRLRDMIENNHIDEMRDMMRRATARRALFDKKPPKEHKKESKN